MNKKGLKVLFILPEYYPHSGGGISTYYINYINSLLPFCEKIKVIIGSGYFQGDVSTTYNGIEIEHLKPQLFEKYFQKFKHYDIFLEHRKGLAASWAMQEQSEYGKDYDIIECTDFGLGYIAWLINQKKPVITRLHGSEGQIEINEPSLNRNLIGNINKLTEYSLLLVSTKLVTYSTANKLFWQQIFPNKPIDLIHPTFNAAIGLSLKYKNSFATVLGRIQQWKGPDILCEALTGLDFKIEPINWFGRDTMYSSTVSTTQKLSNKYPLVWNTYILHKLPVNNEHIPLIQQQTKFGIIPSTWDMFNFTCIEFLSVGTPVICSEGAGASELVIDGVNGFKYPDNDPIKLRECLYRASILTNDQYAEMSKKAIETIHNKLAPNIIIPKNLEIYQDSISSFSVQKTNAYLEKIFSPSDHGYSYNEILDQQPLKTLLNYLSKRIIQKLKS
ncbi:glycosyltransferase family 1 protein [Pedobacter frigiditerrae]|uniref:Glycosyltransferase family 1 protein n=1 Tax=Pedobacter frigiditerrae TaxID=2530452 RepID=A0A4R0N1M0_9SPHI|nr:glycosyltransferase [Pedobacter frigiditerrae]TCC92252.1 glycosyltransferase family 1 protein [Pedobacter frigiditerrae]